MVMGAVISFKGHAAALFKEKRTYHEVESRNDRKFGWLQAHSDGADAVNEVTPGCDDAVPWGHCVQAPQWIGQTVPTLASASEQEAANSLGPQLEVQTTEEPLLWMSGPDNAVLPLMVTDVESMATPPPPSDMIAPPCVRNISTEISKILHYA